MKKTAALCLRFDIDTFSTRHHFTADVGWGEYTYIPKILELGKQFGVQFQFCTCGMGLKEYPAVHQAIKAAGHAIDSHLYTHTVMLIDELAKIEHELELTEKEFTVHDIPWTGIGATGGHRNGIDDHPSVQKLLTDRGYQWCSSRYDFDRSLVDSQPYWLNSQLLEIPFAGLSDRHYFYDVKAPIEGFVRILTLHLERASEQSLVFVVGLHPGVLAKFDPDCLLIKSLVKQALDLALPICTMRQIYETARDEIGCRANGK